jgi:hypothetical protein
VARVWHGFGVYFHYCFSLCALKIYLLIHVFQYFGGEFSRYTRKQAINEAIMQRITRRAAKEQGLELYFTGKYCKYGHISQRRVSDCQCLECPHRAKSKKLKPFDEFEIMISPFENLMS